jgi:hypothetical protein
MLEDWDEQYQGAVDTLDVKYHEGIAYMSIHTVDIINTSLMEILDYAIEASEEANEEFITPDIINGALWVMRVWKQLHDELDLRAEVTEIPDTVPPNLLNEDNN